MINIDKLQLLKRLVIVADNSQYLKSPDYPHFYDYQINKDYLIIVNALLPKANLVEYAFKVMEVPFNVALPEVYEKNLKCEISSPHREKKIPAEFNVCFGYGIDLRTISMLTNILRQVYGDALKVYISYVTNPAGKQNLIVIGNYYCDEAYFANIAGPFIANDVLCLYGRQNLEVELSRFFPNLNFEKWGGSFAFSENHNGVYSGYYDLIEYDELDFFRDHQDKLNENDVNDDNSADDSIGYENYTDNDAYRDGGGGSEWSDPTLFW
ncbi:hypothetical protein D770_04710 [Flammeovirgaceae bacterium 311]|nr:hypothetical protein D770_04710 [Flammeovirgaceae bacterium 311]